MGKNTKDQLDELILASLLQGNTYRATAIEVGCSLSTVQRRMNGPDSAGFRRRLQEAQASMVERVKASIVHKTADAADTLWKIQADENGESTRDGCTQRIMAARALVSAFGQLIPKPQADPFDGASTPAVYSVLVGVDPEVLQ
jgi:hypothetical protein